MDSNPLFLSVLKTRRPASRVALDFPLVCLSGALALERVYRSHFFDATLRHSSAATFRSSQGCLPSA